MMRNKKELRPPRHIAQSIPSFKLLQTEDVAATGKHSLPVVRKLVRGLGLTVVCRNNQLSGCEPLEELRVGRTWPEGAAGACLCWGLEFQAQ